MPSEAILDRGNRDAWQGSPSGEPRVGLLLMDSSLNPISCNDETIRILSYPEAPSI